MGNSLYVDPAHRQSFRDEIEAEGVVRGFESEIYRRDGSTTWISENARVVRDKAGALLYYEGTVEDISDRRRAEKEIFRLNQHLKERLGELKRCVESTKPSTHATTCRRYSRCCCRRCANN